MRKAIPRFIITITVRIVGFSTISFTPFLLSHLPLPGEFPAPHPRDEDAAFALALPGLRGPCPALHVRAEQRQQTAYLTQITLSKLPGPVLVLWKRQHKVCFPCVLSAALAHVRLCCSGVLAQLTVCSTAQILGRNCSKCRQAWPTSSGYSLVYHSWRVCFSLPLLTASGSG